MVVLHLGPIFQLQKNMEEISKLELRICRVIIKYAPFIIAIGYFIMAISACFGFVPHIISIFCSMSIIPFIVLISISKLLKFCSWHRLPLWYSVLIDLLNAIYFYFNIPIGSKFAIAIYLLITIVFILIGMYLKEKRNVKNRTT